MTLGLDTYCLDEIKSGRLVSGALLVGQNLYHRLITPRGMLPGGDDEAKFGEDLESLCGSVESKALAATLPGRLSNAALEDERIEDVDVNVERSVASNGDVSLAITIDAVTALGTFQLVLSVSSVTVTLLGLTEIS